MITIYGKVKKGQDRGKRLGFPTANIALNKKIDEGVYLSYTVIEGIEYPSLTFVGKAKTFNEDKIQAESYIINLGQDIYGKKIKIKLIKKIRGNIKFNSKEELIAQMQKDKKIALDFFK